MLKIVIVVALATILYFLFRAISKQKEKSLPSVSDEIFVEEYIKLYGYDVYEDIVREREKLANYFNINRLKINVSGKLNDLAKSFGTTGGYVAVNDIVYDLYDLGYGENIKDVNLPETSGELIKLFLSLKKR